MLKMFNALHDIVAYANTYCAQEDAAARAAAARARANMKAILTPITITEEQEQESRAILRTMLSDLGITPSTSPTT